MDNYFIIALLAQMLGGVVSAVGVIVGLRLALPSLARALVREIDTARLARGDVEAPRDRPVVTLERDR